MADLKGKGKGGLSALFMSSSHEEEEVKEEFQEEKKEEFQEEEVWGLTLIPNPDADSSPYKYKMIQSVPAWRLKAENPPPSQPCDGSKAIDFPDWAKILKEEPDKKQWWDDDEYDVNRVKDDDDEEDFSGRKSYRPQVVKGEDDEEDDLLPPHELLAKRYKKNRAAYSMCEGVGRTLKGRDLRKVRNTVLFMTGYIETM